MAQAVILLGMFTTEGIVLSVVDFQDYHQIATLLTPDLGVQKLVGSRARSPRSALFGCFQPLNLLEINFRRTGRDLERAHNVTLLHAHVEIRQSLEKLSAGCGMLTAVSKSQMAHKPVPMLYALLKSYLALLAKAKDGNALLPSFQLKLLRHEGILAIQSQCSQCGLEAEEIAIVGGQVACATHGQGLSFSKEETALFYALALSTSASLLQELAIPVSLASKIADLWTKELLV